MEPVAGSIPVILGSRSPSRQATLTRGGAQFSVLTAGINEKLIRHPDPATLTVLLANAKARDIARRTSGRMLLITADQVTTFRGQIREKPESAAQCASWLRDYSHRGFTLVTTVQVTDTASHQARHAIVHCDVCIGEIREAEIWRSLSRGLALTVCGGFVLEDPDLAPRIAGMYCDVPEEDEMSVAIGLPLRTTFRLLREMGW